VGLILGVTPRISPDGMVVMEVDAEKSEVGPEAEGIPVSISATGEVIRSPRIDITTAQTTVSAANGQTIVLGGLITKRMSTTDRRVPFLGDIPILGWLFRYDADQTRRTELLIVLTPRVVLGPEDAERIKEVEAARMSWTCSAVHKLHGPGLCNDRDCEVCRSEAPVIYPDLNPRGIEIDKIEEYVVPGSEREMPGSMPAMQPTPGSEMIPQGPILVPPEELPPPTTNPPANGGPTLPLGRARPALIPTNPARTRAREPAAVTPAAYNQAPGGVDARLPIVEPRQLPSRPAMPPPQQPALAPPVAVSRLPTTDRYVR
jgi:hypothetical protein